MTIATPLSTSGRFIVDAHGNRVKLAGVNWYGASEDMGVPVGLDCNDRNAIAELIADVDWCWWALNSTHGQYPAVITMLQVLMQPRTGPGIA